ncbi:MAG: H(2):CoB-CoM heterodisulfide ferredoxin reductase subunit HdrA [Promethearchaeota archaeon]
MSDEQDLKIGVYVCHCGINIAGVLDVEALEEFAKTLPHVAVARNYKFMCSDNGQELIKEDLREGRINRVVVAACSPRMHEPTFRRTMQAVDHNPFLFEQANIREHVSWVNMTEPDKAQETAMDVIRIAVAKVAKLEELEVAVVPVERSCLILGAGIAGMNAALDLADQGYDVHLVEREPTIGGHMAQLDKTFPTMDCSACILTPKMVDVSRHPKIHLHAYSELESVTGYVGNFTATIREKSHWVDQDACTGCGECTLHCPVTTGNEFDLGLQDRRAIYLPFPQAVPGKYTIDKEACVQCGICAKPEVCEPRAIRLGEADKTVEVKVGTIIVATGWKPFDPSKLKEYGFGKYENVITSLQMERLLSSYGPCLGKPVRPSDGKAPHSIVFVQCVGSRNYREGGNKYCSRVCCMYAIKQARQYKEKHPEAEITIFYMDVRAFGKGYEEFYESASREYGINFVRGRLAEVRGGKNGNVIVRGEDTLLQTPVELETELVVLSVGLEPQDDADKICQLLSIQTSADGFFLEAHPKLRPVDCLTDGIFVAGVAQGPKDIPDAVSQAKGAASGAANLMARGEVEIEPYYSYVREEACSGCRSCVNQCPFGAITVDPAREVAHVNTAMCKGCGTCVATCPCNAIEQNHFRSVQIYSQIENAMPY